MCIYGLCTRLIAKCSKIEVNQIAVFTSALVFNSSLVGEIDLAYFINEENCIFCVSWNVHHSHFR